MSQVSTKNTSLAVKYRPHTFEDVVGQDNVVTILLNQLSNENSKQGYLFTGGAGTGKTTIARILAREMNGGSYNTDIIEIDAASNNGVESIREIRESCKYKPISSKFKIYIIDEVHMVSTGGFNALLKTLEEPPPHAVFILATTDPHKIPATILSRVQRFDFTRLSVEQIMGRLSYIIDQENATLQDEFKLEIADDVLEYLAKLANGGMRNAISLLDTIIGYSSKASLQDVFNILGLPEYDDYLNLLVNLHNGFKAEVIQSIENLYVSGKDVKRFMLGLTEFIVDLQKVALLQNFDYVNIPSNYFERVEKAVSVLGEAKLSNWFKEFVKINNRIKYESNPKVLVQGELLGLC